MRCTVDVPENAFALEGYYSVSDRSQVEIGARVQFECDDGYELIGNENLVCLTDGQFDGSYPICNSDDRGNSITK